MSKPRGLCNEGRTRPRRCRRVRAAAPHVDAALLQAHEFPEAAVAREAAVRGSPPASADI